MNDNNTKSSAEPLVVFPDWYDERAEFETPAKGWLNGVIVQDVSGVGYPVSFIDPVRLQQDMEEYVKQGTPYFSEPGLIVLDEVTTEAIQTAVAELWKNGYFEHLKPLDETRVAAANKTAANA